MGDNIVGSILTIIMLVRISYHALIATRDIRIYIAQVVSIIT